MSMGTLPQIVRRPRCQILCKFYANRIKLLSLHLPQCTCVRDQSGVSKYEYYFPVTRNVHFQELFIFKNLFFSII
jgi:hypothetical protein